MLHCSCAPTFNARQHFQSPFKNCVKPPRHFLLASPRPLRLRAVLPVNLKLFSARFIINVLRCFPPPRTDAQRQTASSTFFPRTRVWHSVLLSAPPLRFFLLLITVILQLATLADERTTSSRFRYVTQRVCSHASCTLVSHLLHLGGVASPAGRSLVGAISHLVAALFFMCGYLV